MGSEIHLTRRAGSWVSAALFVAVILAALLLTAQITVYCDDFFYGVFFRDGLKNFLELTKWHYENFNGRVFIHIMAQLTLLFDTKLYTLLCPLMLACVFLLGGRLQTKEVPVPLLLLTAALGIMAVLALPLQFLNTSILWISAGFNYLFPPCVLLFAFWLYRKGGGRWYWAAVLAVSFLAGATTEQSGLAAVAILGGWGLLGWLRKELPFWRGLLPGLLAGIGYLTIIVAPGTWVRMDGAAGGGLRALLDPATLVRRVNDSMTYMTGEKGLIALFPVFALLTALLVLLTRSGSRLFLLGIPAAGVYLLFACTGHWAKATAISLLYLAFAAVLWLLRPESTPRGLLILAVLALQLVMIVPGESMQRTTIPAILLTLSVCASMLSQCLTRVPLWSAVLIAAVGVGALFPAYLPTFRGYAANAVIARENNRQFRSGEDPVRINVDVNRAYGHTVFFTSDYFLINAVKYYDVGEKKITYESETRQVSGLYCGDVGLPAVQDGDLLYLPIQCTARLCGGGGEWVGRYDATTLTANGVSYLVQNNGEVYEWDPEAKERGELVTHTWILAPWYTFYAQANVICELLNISLEYNAEENIYYIHNPAEE